MRTYVSANGVRPSRVAALPLEVPVKWVVLIAELVALAPFALLLNRNQWMAPWLWTLVGFLPFVTDPLHLFMAPVAWPDWPGHITGLEITVLDFLVLSYLLSGPPGKGGYPFLLSMGLYAVSVLMSASQAAFPTATMFHVWEILRMLMLGAVLARACADPRIAPALLFGLALGIGLEAAVSLWQRLHGVIQTPGTFDHQNQLGLISNLIVIGFFSLFMARPSWSRAALVPAAGLLIAALTASRGAIALFVLGCVAVFLVSVIRQPSKRKFGFAAVGMLVMMAGLPVALASLEKRFAEVPLDESYDERAAFHKAAWLIIEDYPFGTGSNQYITIANVGGYNDLANVAPVVGSRSAMVHNVYLLVWAETGLLGLLAFIFMLVQPVVTALRCGWRNRGDLRSDLLLGLGIALITTYIHSFFEWVFITHQTQYVFAMVCGLIAGLAKQLNYWPERSRVLTPSARPEAHGGDPAGAHA